MSVNIPKNKKTYAPKVGVRTMTIVGINPTLKDLNDLGVNFKEEPRYDGVICFLLKGEFGDINLHWIYITKDEYDSYSYNDSKGNEITKNIYINNKGFVRKLSVEDYESRDETDWFKQPGSRVCRNGEDDLYNFCFKALASFMNMYEIEEFRFDTYDKFLEGNVEELKELFSQEEFQIKVLVGIDDKGRTRIMREYLSIKDQVSDWFISQAKKFSNRADFGYVKEHRIEDGQFVDNMTEALVERNYIPTKIKKDTIEDEKQLGASDLQSIRDLDNIEF